MTPMTSERLTQARWSVIALFFIAGVLFSSWLSRIPSIRDELGLREDQLAGVLLWGAVGALVALSITGWVVAKYGTKNVLIWSAVSFTITYAMLGFGSHLGLVLLFAAGNFFGGFSFAFTNVTMNAEAAAVERRMGTTVMPRFHAAFSVGAVTGAGVGAGFAYFDIEPLWQFIGVGVTMLVARLFVIPMAVVDGLPVASGAGRPSGPLAMAMTQYKNPRIVLIGLVVFASGLSEGAANQWVALAIVDGFDKPDEVGAMIYGLFVLSMVTVRWWGIKLIDKLGRVVALRLSASAVIVGLLIFGLAPSFAWMPLGVLIWGAGAALAMPIGFSAGADDPKSAAGGVAAVSSFGTIAGIAGPQLLGYFAHIWTTREALLLLCIAAAAAIILAPAVRKTTHSAEHEVLGLNVR